MVEPFLKVRGKVATLLMPNIDTDTIMPKNFLKRIDRNGLDIGFFHDFRFDADGNEKSDFVLNAKAKRDATFLLVGPNFGCGSSREHAVWGMRQFGFRAVIGTSFGGIFYDNCVRNGVLVVELSDTQIDALSTLGEADCETEIEIDLPMQRIHREGAAPINFEIEEIKKKSLVRGLDLIGQTLERKEEISSFEAAFRKQQPWLFASVSRS